MVALEETLRVPLTVTEQGTIRVKGSRVSLDSIVHHFKLGPRPNRLRKVFLRSISATSTRPSPITSRTAKPSKNTLNSKKQRPMHFKNRWNLILSIKAQSGNCAHGFCLDGQNGSRTTVP